MFVYLIIAGVLGVICGILAAMGGAGNLIWRREAMPGVLCVFSTVCLVIHFGFSLYLFLGLIPMALWGVESLGYGIPDANDKGSLLGRLWTKVFKGNLNLATIFTRGTVGVLKALVWVVIPIISGHWFLYIGFAILTIFNQILWAEMIKGLKTYKLFGKELLWEETFLNGIDVFLMVLLVLFSFFGL